MTASCRCAKRSRTANDNAATNADGPAGEVSDNILFDASLSGGTLTLTGGALEITDDVYIEGDINEDNLANITIDAQSNSQIFHVHAATDASTYGGSFLSGLNLINGNAIGSGYGGAVYAVGGSKLGMRSVTISDSTASYSGGGVFSAGELSVESSTISNNTSGFGDGAGIYSVGDLAISYSTVSNNVGNGIYASNAMTMSNTTVVGNGTSDFNGGGVVAAVGSRIVNSTITGNTADSAGGLLVYAGDSEEKVTLLNTIVLGNTANSNVDVHGVTELPDSPILYTSSITSQQTGMSPAPETVFAEVDANGGGVLADNGGLVQTVALLADANNPALDKYTPTSFAVSFEVGMNDATGNGRGVDLDGVDNGGFADAGAYELQALPTADETPSLVVTTLTDVVDATDGETSLREAVAFANSDADQSDITFADGLAGTITLTGGELAVTSDVSIDGDSDADGEGDITLDADSASRIMSFDGGTSEVSNMTLTNGSVEEANGGAIFSSAVLTVTNTTFTNSTAAKVNSFTAGIGGAIYSSGTLNVKDSTFTGNEGELGGGAIYTVGALTIEDSTFSDNVSGSDGGAVEVNNGETTILGSEFNDNTANSYGGGLYTRRADLVIENSVFNGNYASDYGGGFAATGGTLTATNVAVTDNESDSYGGGIYAGGETTIADSTITGNTSSQNGGAIYFEDNATITNTTISNNTAAGGGGAIYTYGDVLDITGSTISDNIATGDVGGGIYSYNEVNVTDSTISGNQANGSGGGIYSEDGPVTVVNSTVDGNSAEDYGGGIYTGGDLTLTGAVISNNTNNDYGGGVYVGGAATISGSEFNGNESTSYGGGLYASDDATITDTIFTDNKSEYDGGGLYVSGVLEMTDSTVTNNSVADGSGGGLWSSDDATITNTVFTGNSASVNGGGLHAENLTLTSSTVANNTASGAGGGVEADGDLTVTGSTISGNTGNGIFAAAALNVMNSTIVGNDASASTGNYANFGGGISAQQGAVITNTTITGNTGVAGGGVFIPENANLPEAQLVNSIVTGNTSNFGTDVFAESEIGITVLTATSSIVSVADASAVFASVDANGAGVLADNGGNVQTVALKDDASNPALDVGTSAEEYDAAGNARDVDQTNADNGGTVDAGALELQTQAVPPAEPELPADFDLVLDTQETGSWGHRFNGETDDDGTIIASFEGTGSDLVLDLQGFDIDYDTEVELFLNGVSIGFLDEGVNNGTEAFTIAIAAGDQLTGDNNIKFQNKSPAWKWGVTDLLLTEGQPPADNALELDTIETASFGKGFNGTRDDDGKVSFGFEKTDTDLVLDFKGFDIDTDEELEVLVNDVSQGFLMNGANNGLSTYQVAVAAEDQVEGENTVEFLNTNEKYKWGVTDLVLSEGQPSTADFTLEVGTADTGNYGNRFNGTSDTDGRVTFGFEKSDEDVELSFKGFDIDFGYELEWFLNGTSQGDLQVGADNDLADYMFEIAAADQVEGENVIAFENHKSNWTWGVTDLLISPADTLEI